MNLPTRRIAAKLTGLISFAVLIIFGWYLVANYHSFKQLLDIPLLFVLALVALNVVKIYNNGLFIKYSLDFYDKHIGDRESFYVALLTAIGNFFGPFLGGAGVRAIYLKKKHRLSYTDFAATLSGFYFITFIVNAAIGLLALVVIQAQLHLASWIMYITFAGWLTASLVLAEVKNIDRIADLAKRASFLGRLTTYINNSVHGWQAIKRDKKLIARLNRVTVYGFLILYAITYIEFRAVHVNASIASLSLYVTISALSLLVSVTPGAIGVREAMFIFTSRLISLNTSQILAIAVIDRAATFVVLLGGYLILKSHGYYKNRSISAS